MFTVSHFLKYGSRATVGRTLSRLVDQGEIRRVARGVFVRPEFSRYVGEVTPGIRDIVAAIAKNNNETIEIHGAEAVRLFKISTQVPLAPVYYTSASSRTIVVGKFKVKMIHTSDWRLLQFAGTKTGLALSALWYVEKHNINSEVVSKIKAGLSEEEFNELKSGDLPAWIAAALDEYG